MRRLRREMRRKGEEAMPQGEAHLRCHCDTAYIMYI
jgi:hypothetical protein